LIYFISPSNMEQSKMSFKELSEKLNKFNEDRNWINLDPEDLAKSIVLESAELLEHFQRDNTLKKRWDKLPEKNIEEISHEVWDIVNYLMRFCHEMNIDIVDATLKKLEKVGKKYPVWYKQNWWHEEYLKIKKSYRT